MAGKRPASEPAAAVARLSTGSAVDIEQVGTQDRTTLRALTPPLRPLHAGRHPAGYLCRTVVPGEHVSRIA
jgi:hypothetical protein